MSSSQRSPARTVLGRCPFERHAVRSVPTATFALCLVRGTRVLAWRSGAISKKAIDEAPTQQATPWRKHPSHRQSVTRVEQLAPVTVSVQACTEGVARSSPPPHEHGWPHRGPGEPKRPFPLVKIRPRCRIPSVIAAIRASHWQNLGAHRGPVACLTVRLHAGSRGTMSVITATRAMQATSCRHLRSVPEPNAALLGRRREAAGTLGSVLSRPAHGLEARVAPL